MRTAAEGISAEELERDVQRLARQWEAIEALAAKSQAPALLYQEPDMAVRVIREEFNDDYRQVIIDDDTLFEEVRDLGYIAFWPENKGRDGCRTPMVWEQEAPYAGFSTGEPWLPVKEPQRARAVDAQEARNDSVLHAYRSTLALRRSHPALREGSARFLDLPEPVLGIVRESGGGAT